MNRNEVIKKLNTPDEMLGVIDNKYGQSVAVLEYYLYTRFILYPSCFPKPVNCQPDYKIYWLFFADGILVKVQEGERWSKDMERKIYRTKY